MSNDDDDDDQDAPNFSPTAWHDKNPNLATLFVPRGLPVQDSEDLERVLNLPRRPAVTEGSATAEALIELAQEKYYLGDRPNCKCREINPKHPCIKRLFWVQAWMLHEINVVGGLLASVNTGAGKSLPWILAPLALRDCPLCLLLIPPSLVDQIITQYKLIAEHWRVPGISVHMSNKKTWTRVPAIGPNGKPEPMLHVLPYTKLSSVNSSDWIERLKPDAIIADEVDSLKSLSSSRTIRLLRAIESDERIKFVGGTGSLTDSSVSEFAHLSALALRHGSPLPLEKEVIDEWSRCLDAVPNPCPPGALIRLLNPGEGIHQVRSAFRRRLAETPGFIMIGGKQIITTSGGNEVDIDIRERVPPALPPIIEEALEKVRNFQRPDTLAGNEEDEILVDPLEQSKCAREVATGMFYRWIFPRGESRDLILEWYAARKLWNSELRYKMLRGEVHLDSPKLCENAAKRAWRDDPQVEGLPDWKAEHWPRWRDVMDRVEPKTQAVRLHPYLVEDAADWALSNKGIVWYGMREFAAWLRELTGLPVYGEGSGADIVKETGDRSIIASIMSHGRGRDMLQYAFNHQLIINTISSSRRLQQLLARLHRRGQESGAVVTEVYLHVQELVDSFEQALRRGEYVEALTGERQKLLIGWQGDE